MAKSEELDDEYFSYFRKRHAFWKMYGLSLPDVVLKKVYYENALKLGLDHSTWKVLTKLVIGMVLFNIRSTKRQIIGVLIGLARR